MDQNISELQTKLNRLDVIVHAMWELLKENDVGEEKLRAKVNEVIANGPKSRRPSYEPIIVKYENEFYTTYNDVFKKVQEKISKFHNKFG